MEQGRLLIMAGQQLTSFEHVLLGMICLSPSSGYDLKRIFATTPMGFYQPSSGALYPALRRLETKANGGGPDDPRGLAPHASRSSHGLA
jgi:hypothetical protein